MVHKRTIWWLLGIVLLVLLGFSGGPEMRSGAAEKKSIEQKVAGADCIVIDSNTRPGEGGAVEEFTGRRLPTTRVADPDAVRKLLGGIEFESTFARGHCMCFGEVALRFCQGDHELLALTLHHGSTLRILDSNWGRNANMPLTEASRAFVTAWLNSYGWRSPITSGPASDSVERER